MGSVFPRWPTPVDVESAAVEPSSTSDMTEREVAPPAWPASAKVVLPPPPMPSEGAVRSRKPTLVSPIPALLAAQMSEFADESSDATPLPMERQEATSRFDISAQRALLATDDEDESAYVVELMPPPKPDR